MGPDLPRLGLRTLEGLGLQGLRRLATSGFIYGFFFITYAACAILEHSLVLDSNYGFTGENGTNLGRMEAIVYENLKPHQIIAAMTPTKGRKL